MAGQRLCVPCVKDGVLSCTCIWTWPLLPSEDLCKLDQRKPVTCVSYYETHSYHCIGSKTTRWTHVSAFPQPCVNDRSDEWSCPLEATAAAPGLSTGLETECEVSPDEVRLSLLCPHNQEVVIYYFLFISEVLMEESRAPGFTLECKTFYDRSCLLHAVFYCGYISHLHLKKKTLATFHKLCTVHFFSLKFIKNQWTWKQGYITLFAEC